jgi:hypothetical protein
MSRLSEFELARIQRMRYVERRAARDVATELGISYKTVLYHAPGDVGAVRTCVRGARVDVVRLRTLRYRDGLTVGATALELGCESSTVQRHAPGWVGKVDNTLLRQAFDASGVRAVDVARCLGWTYERRSGRRAGALEADGSRVLRALGLQQDVGHGHRSHRQMIDAETACLIADAIGVPPDVVGATEDMSHLIAV